MILYMCMVRGARERMVYMCMLSRSVMSDSVQPRGSSVHGILQGRILEWVAIPFSRGSS